MYALKNLKIAEKIALTLLAVLVVTIASNVASIRSIDANNEATRWNAHTYDVLAELNRLTAGMVDQETGVRGYLISGDEDFLAPYRSGGQAFETALSNIRTLTADNPAQQARLTALAGSAKQWRDSIAEKEIALMRQPATRGEALRMEASGDGKASMDAVRAKARELAAVETDLLQKRSAIMGESARNSYYTNVAALVAGVVVALIGLAALHVGLVRPIRAMTDAMSRLAANDLSSAIPGLGRRDELGAMAAAVGIFKDNLIRTKTLEQEAAAARLSVEAQRKAAMRDLADAFEGAVGGIVTAVSSASTELQVTAQSMSVTATDTRSQSTTAAAAADQAATNVTMVASAAEELGTSVQEIGRQASSAANLAGNAVRQAAETATLVAALSQGASKIGDVVGMISTIASQTNLLALNATIEAARAGEAGRGFAVVATEVKELAGQTSRATDEISRQIGEIQAATTQAVTAITGIANSVREMSSVATTIAAAVEEQGAATQEIVRNVAQAAVGTTEVTSSIAGVASAASGTGEAAGHVLAAASELSQQSEHLGLEVGRFLSNVRAA